MTRPLAAEQEILRYCLGQKFNLKYVVILSFRSFCCCFYSVDSVIQLRKKVTATNKEKLMQNSRFNEEVSDMLFQIDTIAVCCEASNESMIGRIFISFLKRRLLALLFFES